MHIKDAVNPRPKRRKRRRLKIDEYLSESEIGDAFRGLWKSYYLDDKDKPNIKKWNVTFIFKGHYVETPEFDNPVDALDWAWKKLKEDK